MRACTHACVCMCKCKVHVRVRACLQCEQACMPATALSDRQPARQALRPPCQGSSRAKTCKTKPFTHPHPAYAGGGAGVGSSGRQQPRFELCIHFASAWEVPSLAAPLKNVCDGAHARARCLPARQAGTAVNCAHAPSGVGGGRHAALHGALRWVRQGEGGCTGCVMRPSNQIRQGAAQGAGRRLAVARTGIGRAGCRQVGQAPGAG